MSGELPEAGFAGIARLGAALRDGALSSVELTRRCLDRIAALDPRLHAFVQVLEASAERDAAAADQRLASGDAGPLCGIPFAAKDLFDVAGLPTMAGCSLLRDNIAAADAHTVARLRDAGMVLLGKTHTVQFAYGGVGVNHDLGTPCNPWAQTPSVAGGSSSGSAVAVAAGLAPVALGSDTGGSVRLPAALCGVTGLKTTVGQVSRDGVFPLSHSLDTVGPLCRDAHDAALVYAAMAGRDARDAATDCYRRQDVRAALGRGLKGLRLAVGEGVFWEDLDPEVAGAVRAAVEELAGAGAEVSTLDLPAASGARELNRTGLVIAAEAYANNRELLESRFDALDPIVARRMLRGRDVPAADYLGSVYRWHRLRVEVIEQLRGVDALLVPTSPIAALPIATVDADLQIYSEYNLRYLRNTSIGNVLNLCGLSVPCGFTGAGLPIGLMIYARPYAEAMALRVGHAYQQLTDWHTRQPSLCG